MTYSQKLRDPRWQKKRLQILERDGWKCCCCGSSTRNLQVHHLVYLKCDPWDYEDEHLQTLCDECHEIRQGITDDVSNHLKLSISHLSLDDLVSFGDRFMSNSGVGNPFRERISMQLNHALDLADAGMTPIHFTLSCQLIESFVAVSFQPSKQSANDLEAAMGMVSDKISGLTEGGK